MQAFNAFFEEFKNMDHKLNYGLSTADDGELDSFLLCTSSQLILVSPERMFMAFQCKHGAFNFFSTVVEFLILMKIFVQPITWEVDFGNSVNGSNNWTLCKSLHFKLVCFASASDELTSKAAEILYTQDFRSSSRLEKKKKKKKILTKAEVFLLVLVLSG